MSEKLLLIGVIPIIVLLIILGWLTLMGRRKEKFTLTLRGLGINITFTKEKQE